MERLSSLKLTPAKELTFPRAIGKSSTISLQLKNEENQRIAFKVKTTAPRSYLVRPNQGFLDPQQSLDVNIILQPLKEEPPAESSDKFLVQSATVPAGFDGDVSKLLAELTEKDKNLIQSHRLKVVFEPASSPSSDASYPSSHTHDNSEAAPVASPSSLYTATPAVAASANEDFQRLDKDYSKLLQEIKSLKTQNEELERQLQQGLHQRKVASSSHEDGGKSAGDLGGKKVQVVNQGVPFWLVIVFVALSLLVGKYVL
eukprot:GILI01002702.1.p1 GENE.GILI01002702.1~~GILI01002702.1.p1  ORF type:complete len:258 (-),score=99.00 GILI01002702.1:406-1179(-)